VETNEGSIVRVLRAILYARVSKKKQAEEGYSLDQQIERLREYASEQGYEIVEEVIDPGYSGAVLERPGLDRVRDLVAAGGVDIVLAQDRDRIARDPDILSLLRYEFAKHGCVVRAITDRSDGTPQGDFQDGILEQVAKYERALTMERTRRNKRKKAREGKVVGGHHAAYGYEYVLDQDGKVTDYAVNEAEMQTVRRIFSDIASGKGIRGVKDNLDSEHVPSPRGGLWTTQFIRNLIPSDLYKPHTIEELRAMGVSETVLTDLDASQHYGVYRFDEIPVPVPDAGIPLEVVREARYRVENNRASERPPNRVSKRVWELSGGVLRCAGCGRAMQTVFVQPRVITYHYYRCVGQKQGKADPCDIRTHVPAEAIEQEVWEAVRRLMDDKEYVLRKAREHFAAQRKELTRAGSNAKDLAGRLEKIEAKRIKYQHAYAADALSLADLKERMAELDNERGVLKRELDRARNRDVELATLDEAEREITERIETTEDNLEDMTPEKRRDLYQDLHLRVEVGEDKRPYISGIFPTRVAGITGTLLRTPDQRGYLYEHAGAVSERESSLLPKYPPTPRSAKQ
jgi:site-specific DNA recombinase